MWSQNRDDCGPDGLVLWVATFTWKYLDTNYPMEFIGGFMGVKQDRHSLFLRPEIGWVVRETLVRDKKGRGR